MPLLTTGKNPLNFAIAASSGAINGISVVNKFGRNSNIGATPAPICLSGFYRTPQVGGATTLRIKAGGDANDTAAGTGAQEVTLQGLDQTGALATEALATAGASASSATSTTFMRLFRAYVSKSGTYATQSAGSHAATITIENGAGGTDWAVLSATTFPRAQTLIGAYSVPLGYTAYLEDAVISVDATKKAALYLFQRQNILETSAPYSAMRLVEEYASVPEGVHALKFEAPIKFPALTDFGFMGYVATGSADVSISFDIILQRT